MSEDKQKIHVLPFAGKRTPKQAVVDCFEDLDDDAQIAVVVYLDKDNGIHTSWSGGSLLMRTGMLEFAKMRMIDINIAQQDAEREDEESPF